YVISDEIYDEIIYEGHHEIALNESSYLNERVISIYGFSKSFAMTGWRLAYAIVPEHLYPVMTKLQEPITTCASSVSQKAGEAALTSPLAEGFLNKMNQTYKKKRDMSCKLLKEYNMSFIKPYGAFYISIDVSNSGMDSMKFSKELLREKKVAVAPGSSFGPSGNKMIRICFAGDQNELKKGIQKIGDFYLKIIQKQKRLKE